MLKKTIKTAIIGIALLIVGATANAAMYEVNLYGASAQYTYWLKASPEFMVVAAPNGLGCAQANIWGAQSSDGKHGITVCMGDTAVGDPDHGGLAAQSSGGATINGNTNQTVVIRYSSKASYDGVNAVQGKNPASSPECTNKAQRNMADESLTTNVWQNFDGSAGWVPALDTLKGLACKTVIIGASDVRATTFNQKSHGQLKGHLGGGWEDRDITGYTISAADYYDSTPLVVPFGFYANNNVPFDNLSRLMATQIFSGAVINWNQFDPSLGSKGIVVCMRHAGSGTLATLDAAVMRADATLCQTENQPGDPANYDDTVPIIWFNDGSSDEKNCLSGNGGQDATWGAVGYLDADTTPPGGTKRLSWMGVAPTKSVIKNGMYDFWSPQNLYWSKTLSTNMTWLINRLVGFASNPAYLTVARFGSVANYWCTMGEMKVKKDTDKQYPYRF